MNFPELTFTKFTFISQLFAKTSYTKPESTQRPCNTSRTSLLRSCFNSPRTSKNSFFCFSCYLTENEVSPNLYRNHSNCCVATSLPVLPTFTHSLTHSLTHSHTHTHARTHTHTLKCWDKTRIRTKK
jgi:hypothetical protein